MEKIEHKYVQVVNGLKLHVAEAGSASSPAVVFLHGFPEIWYSWRHQVVAVAEAGFRAIAPDYRGYGLSDQPPEPEKATWSDFIADISALFDALSICKAFVIGTDVGAILAYLFALHHPEKVSGVITLGVPCLPPGPMNFHENLPEGFYISRWQKPGRAEADFGRFDSKTIVRNIYILFARSEIPIAEENQEIMDMVDSSTPLPPWFTDEDLEAYGSLYEKSTFRTALKVPYRSLSEEFNLKHDKVEAPTLFVTGENDYFLKFPGIEEYVRGEQSKMFVPKLETVFVPEGTHFVHEQFPDQVNKLILNFLKNNSS